MSTDSDDSFRNPTFYTHSLLSFSFLLTFSLCGNPLSAQEADSTKVRILYEEVIRQTACNGSGNGLSQAEFYDLLENYLKRPQQEPYGYGGSFWERDTLIDHFYFNRDTSSFAQKTTSDTVVRIVYIRDTFVQAAPAPDTVFMSNLPSSEEVATTQEILKKILQDKELSALIRETVAEMPAKELEKFQDDLNKQFREMKSELAMEQARRTVAELEAKKAAAKERKEKWKALSKEERKELIKAHTKIIAGETAQAAGMVALGTGIALAGGVVAIGLGIVKSAVAIWNWLDKHFYIKIDLSCAQQRQLRAYRQTHHHKPSKIKKYKGHCPSWANNH